jgi:hypothetical protein
MDPTGKLFYLDAKTGRSLGSYPMGSTNACGPSIVNSSIYSGSGYLNFGFGAIGMKFTALELR